MNGEEPSSRFRSWQIVAALVLGFGASLWIGAQRGPRGFDPGPLLVDSASLRERVARSRLTIVFAPARPGCSSCIEPPVETLRRFVATYPDAHVVTALQRGLRTGSDIVVGGDRFELRGKTGPRFAGQDLGVVAAFDRAGRTLLFRVLTHTSFERLYDDLETAYSLTAPKNSLWAQVETPL